MTTSNPAPAAQPELFSIAAETMVGDLMSLTLDELKHASDVWQRLAEGEQDDVLERVEKRVKDAVIQCVRLMATQGFTRVPATLEAIAIKDSIKAQLSISRTDANRHELTDAQGQVVTLVLANLSQFVDAPHQHKAEPDQLGLALNNIANSDQAKPNDDSAAGDQKAA